MAGLEKGAVKNIVYGRSKNPRIDTVEKLARGLGCSPSELLPLEWQEPGKIDFKMLEESIIYGITVAKRFNPEELSPEKITHLIVIEYIEREAKLRQNTNLQQNNS